MAISHDNNRAPDGREAPGDVSDIKRRLAWRMGFAGLMIVALLAGLALFDYYSAQPEEAADTVQFTEPVPVPKKVVTQPVTSIDPEIVAEHGRSEPEVTSAPVDKNAPPLEPPPRPEVASRPALPRTLQSNTRMVSPVALSTEPKSEPRLATQPVLVGSNGYTLQVGVFSDPLRAEELQARLRTEGIPATIEARVQVGPFRSKGDADTAREKLKSLGIDSVLQMPKSKRR